MTELVADAPRPSKRSRSGCDECRRRHWKCDEAKPTCAFCQSANRLCVYARQLSWGGRPFKKSRFGKCLDSEAQLVSIAVSSTTRDFVYTTTAPRARSSDADLSILPAQHHPKDKELLSAVEGNDTEIAESATPVDDIDTRGPLFSPESSPGLTSFAITPTLPEALRPLFHHFIHGMTISISCHKGIQDEICSTIVPMALEVPHLLSAVLALAAAHWQSSGSDRGGCQFELMKASSLKQLRSALDEFKPADNDQILATTLILCMAEVISPLPSTSSWRSHLHGAATLFSQNSICNGSSGSSTSAFLRRKYQALQAIALACGSKNYDGYILTAPSHEKTQIDDLAGYSTSLLPILREINSLDSLQRFPDTEFTCDEEPSAPHFDCNSPVEHQSHLLYDRIVSLMAKRQMSWTPTDTVLPWAVYQDLYRLDEAYHHMAILQVFRRGSLSVPLQLITESRQAILSCLSAMDYQIGPCPGVAALPPLFVAGSLCTSVTDRKMVRSLLKNMWIKYGMGNVMSCRTVLERWWKQQDESRSAMSTTTDEQATTAYSYQGEMSAFTWTVSEYDVLPY